MTPAAAAVANSVLEFAGGSRVIPSSTQIASFSGLGVTGPIVLLRLFKTIDVQIIVQIKKFGLTEMAIPFGFGGLYPRGSSANDRVASSVAHTSSNAIWNVSSWLAINLRLRCSSRAPLTSLSRR